MNIWDILIVALLAAALLWAILRLKRRKGGCSCGCESCGSVPACCAGKKAGDK